MDLTVCCPQKAAKFNHSLTGSLHHWVISNHGIDFIHRWRKGWKCNYIVLLQKIYSAGKGFIEDMCVRSRHQGQGQVITSYSFCVMYLLVPTLDDCSWHTRRQFRGHAIDLKLIELAGVWKISCYSVLNLCAAHTHVAFIIDCSPRERWWIDFYMHMSFDKNIYECWPCMDK